MKKLFMVKTTEKMTYGTVGYEAVVRAESSDEARDAVLSAGVVQRARVTQAQVTEVNLDGPAGVLSGRRC